MRRGLRRADGFALFIAVCNSPATVGELIRLTAEAMPEVALRTVELEADVADPLAAALAQLPAGSQGPVMVRGLERSNPSTQAEHPVLRTLNLGRPEWPRKLPWPVVLWVPEYLLELLAREAPDFLDWRSDTLHFAASTPEALQKLDDAAWMAGFDGRMAQEDRHSRMEELRSRLATMPESGDRVALEARSDWLYELGNHLHFLGQLDEAERMYQRVLALEEEPGRRRAGAYHMRGWIAQDRGSYDEALEWHQKSLRIKEELGNRAGMASSYHHLGMIAQGRGSSDEALKWYQKSLRIKEELGNRAGMASSYHHLGMIAQDRGSYAEALKWYQKSLRIFEELGNRSGMASSYHHLGIIAQNRGSSDEALKWYQKSLRIEEELGNRSGMASSLSQIGILLTERVEPQEAVPFNLRSLAIRQGLGTPHVRTDIHWLMRQRELLGSERFEALLAEHLDAEGVASVLGVLESGAQVEGR